MPAFFKKLKKQMNKTELLEKIERQSGYIDMVDAFSLISVFTDEFGLRFTTLSPEDELKWMYLKLKGHNLRAAEFEYFEKKCNKCDITKSMDDFAKNQATKDKRDRICRLCKSKTGKVRDVKKIEIENDLLKVCLKCKVEKRHTDFKVYYSGGQRRRKPNCISCEIEMMNLIETRKTKKS